jgi:hypothetical protein
MRPRSPKRARQEREYAKLRVQYLEAHPVCEAQLSGCTGAATEVHHKAGRVGKLLTDPTYFLPICRNCHAYLHDRMSMDEAVAHGLRIRL